MSDNNSCSFLLKPFRSAITSLLDESFTPSFNLDSTSIIYSPLIFKFFISSIFSIFNKLSNLAAFFFV